jgi:hypothetical protein
LREQALLGEHRRQRNHAKPAAGAAEKIASS